MLKVFHLISYIRATLATFAHTPPPMPSSKKKKGGRGKEKERERAREREEGEEEETKSEKEKSKRSKNSLSSLFETDSSYKFKLPVCSFHPVCVCLSVLFW